MCSAQGESRSPPASVTGRTESAATVTFSAAFSVQTQAIASGSGAIPAAPAAASSEISAAAATAGSCRQMRELASSDSMSQSWAASSLWLPAVSDSSSAYVPRRSGVRFRAGYRYLSGRDGSDRAGVPVPAGTGQDGSDRAEVPIPARDGTGRVRQGRGGVGPRQRTVYRRVPVPVGTGQTG